MYTDFVRNVTFSVDAKTLDLARARAQKENRSLNDVVREWIADYAQVEDRVRRFREIMKELDHVELHGPFSREEMNRRR